MLENRLLAFTLSLRLLLLNSWRLFISPLLRCLMRLILRGLPSFGDPFCGARICSKIALASLLKMEKAKSVLSIPRVHLFLLDKLIWYHDQSDYYTMHSSYWNGIHLAGLLGSNGGPLLWRIWYRRNILVNEKKMIYNKLVVEWILEYIERYRKANGLYFHGTSDGYRPVITYKWVKPPDGIIKINCDAGLDILNARAGFGLVKQDSSGGILPMATWPFHGKVTHVMDEATTILYCIGLCVHLG
uniref:Uncharacterized protein n=1 Tax=Cannabis sativa TaxID=3483 RepID=A0A803P1W4_CANSA